MMTKQMDKAKYDIILFMLQQSEFVEAIKDNSTVNV